MLNVILHSVELHNSNTQAKRLIQSVLPISTKWGATQISGRNYTLEVVRENRTIEKFSIVLFMLCTQQ